MKYLLVTFLALSLTLVRSQQMSDFFSSEHQVVMLGLDFSMAKFIGKDGFKNPEGLKSYTIKQWNKFFATEPDKYSLQDFLGLNDNYYYNSINYLIKRNDELVDPYTAITDLPHSITEEQIKENVKTYDTFEKEGLAVTFVVESFSKVEEMATIYVVFMSLPDNNVIHIEKMTGNPGGGGQANYWARSVYNIVSDLEKRSKEFKKM